jgi:hypothetical protein
VLGEGGFELTFSDAVGKVANEQSLLHSASPCVLVPETVAFRSNPTDSML